MIIIKMFTENRELQERWKQTVSFVRAAELGLQMLQEQSKYHRIYSTN